MPSEDVKNKTNNPETSPNPAVAGPVVVDYRHRLPLMSGQTIHVGCDQTEAAGNDE